MSYCKNNFDMLKCKSMGEVLSFVDSIMMTPENYFRKHGSLPITNLDKYISDLQNAPEEEISGMAHGRTRVLMGVSESGKPIYKQVSGRNQDERNDAIVQAYIQSGRIWEFISQDMAVKPTTSKNNSITVAQYAGEWFDRYKRGKLALTTEYQLQQRVKYIQEKFGDKPMKDITTADVQGFFDEYSSHGVETVRTMRGTVSELFKAAEDDGILPVKAIIWNRVKAKGRKVKTRRAATMDEYKDIAAHLSDLTDPVEQLAVAILMFTGMRPEELLGLRWEDIDLSAGKIHIERAAAFAGTRNLREVKEPKTKGSKTWIPIITALAPILENHKQDVGWIIHDDDGNPFETQLRWARKWKDIVSHINLYGLRPCEFRKTVPTIMNAMGVDVKSIQALLRHSKVDTTMNIYAEVEPASFIKGCEQLTAAAG